MSTPLVTVSVSSMVEAILSLVEGWHTHPLAAGPVNPDLMSRTGGSGGFTAGCGDNRQVTGRGP